MKKTLLTSALLMALLCAGCGKTCRCYTYYGNVDEFSEEDLEAYDRSCTGMEDFDYGLRYSLCEWSWIK
ncbi:MAG: hypothetical protein IJM88_01510 [Bacteroidales bacterium]|nr:hypothetical protein [Bacteroidales bacterium]